MTRFLSVCSFWIFVFPAIVISQSISISGKIIDKNTGEGLIGVIVKTESEKGGVSGTSTDIEGNYQLKATPGKYKITVSYLSYQTQQLDISVQSTEDIYLPFALVEEEKNLEEVTIVSTIEKTSMLALLSERKSSATVSDGISAEVIRKTPDRTTSDVMKRLTGASIQENKYAIIRGMNDRYNAGYLDGALLPSSESDRKAFAFDVVPAHLLDNLQIIKSATPDLIGDFGGGIIRINTKSVPEKRTQNISIGLQTHSLTTGQPYTQFRIYPSEMFNWLNGSRDIPMIQKGDLQSASTFPSTQEKIRFAQISQQFNNDWMNETFTAMPNTRLGYSLGIPLMFENSNKLGIILAVNYANTKKVSHGVINSFDGAGQTSALNDDVYQRNVSTGGICNVNYITQNSKISLSNLVSFNTDFHTIIRKGIGNTQDAVEVQNYANMVNANQLTNSILSFKQNFGNSGIGLNAAVNYSLVKRKIPDYRIVNYTKSPDFPEFMLSLGDFFNSSSGRFYSDLKEGIIGGNGEITAKLNSNIFNSDVKLGCFLQERKRNFTSRNFVYGGTAPNQLTLDPQHDLQLSNIREAGLYLIEKTSDDIAYYDGKSLVHACYVMSDQKITEKLRAVYGARFEKSDMQVNNPVTNQSIARINQGTILPSVNLIYILNQKTNIRLDYFSSVNRPEFRELAPFAFFVFDRKAEIKGNPNLQIAQLKNFDFRFEMFPTGSQLISIGGFYKQITNPLEFSLDITQVSTTFTYQNEKSAKVYGLELEVRKKLDFIQNNPFWSDWTIFSNLALIKSKLDFAPGSQAKSSRQLQGQSPYVFNVGLQYEHAKNGWFGSIMMNRIGRRIAFVGVDPKFGNTRQDIYEHPRTVLDLQVGKSTGKWNIKFTCGDLLHQKQTFYQDVNDDKRYTNAKNGDRLIYEFTHGFTTNLSAAITF